MSKCVECGNHIPAYVQVSLCEECYKKLLEQKIKES